MLERGIIAGNPSIQSKPDQSPVSAVLSTVSPPVAPALEDSPLAKAVVGRVSILLSIDQFLRDLAALPQELSDAKKLTQELVVAATDKCALLSDGRYWKREIPAQIKQLISKHYPDVESFLSHQKHLAFPKQIQRNGEPFPVADMTPLHPFSLAVVRHIASPSVKAVDLTPGAGTNIEVGSDGVYSVISFGARLWMFSKLENFFVPHARSFTLMHEGAHHLFCSLAAAKDGGPSWLKHLLVEPPRRTWGLGEVMRSNHATLYGEVLANYSDVQNSVPVKLVKTLPAHHYEFLF